jgi:hypothetical protein
MQWSMAHGLPAEEAAMSPIRPDLVKAQIAGLLRAHPDLAGDDEGLVLSLESETDAAFLCARLVASIKLAEAHRDSVSGFIKELRSRQELLDLRAGNMRRALISILDSAGLKTLPLSIATLSVTRGRHVEIVDPELIPDCFRRQPPWEPMKKEIGNALRGGQEVPGCALADSEPSLSIRSK